MIDRTIRQSGFESQLEGRASALRRSLTVSETGLWRHLVGKCIGSPSDVKFRWIASCLTSRTLSSADCGSRRPLASSARYRGRAPRPTVACLGYRILHLEAALVMREPLVAVERIREACAVAP